MEPLRSPMIFFNHLSVVFPASRQAGMINKIHGRFMTICFSNQYY